MSKHTATQKSSFLLVLVGISLFVPLKCIYAADKPEAPDKILEALSSTKMMTQICLFNNTLYSIGGIVIVEKRKYRCDYENGIVAHFANEEEKRIPRWIDVAKEQANYEAQDIAKSILEK